MILLHHVAQTRSFRVLWALEELGLPYALVAHSMLDGSLRRPAYTALSPASRVPAIEIEGRSLAESGAILQHLSEITGRLGPAAAARPDWLEWIHYAETLGALIANLTQHHVVLREDHMRSPVVMRLEAKRLERALAGVEARIAGDWLLGEAFTMADIAMGYAAWIAARFVRFDALPRTAAWRERLMARPAFARALAADGPPEIYLRDFYPPPETGPGG